MVRRDLFKYAAITVQKMLSAGPVIMSTSTVDMTTGTNDVMTTGTNDVMTTGTNDVMTTTTDDVIVLTTNVPADNTMTSTSTTSDVTMSPSNIWLTLYIANIISYALP